MSGQLRRFSDPVTAAQLNDFATMLEQFFRGVMTNTMELVQHALDPSSGSHSGVLTELYGGTDQSSYAKGDILFASAANTLSKLAIGGVTGHVLTVSAAGVPEWAAAGGTHNMLSATHVDSVAASCVLGDVLAGNATPKWQRIAGNTTATRKFLAQTGTGAVSALPSWAQVAHSDLENNAYGMLYKSAAQDIFFTNNWELVTWSGSVNLLNVSLNSNYLRLGVTGKFLLIYSLQFYNTDATTTYTVAARLLNAAASEIPYSYGQARISAGNSVNITRSVIYDCTAANTDIALQAGCDNGFALANEISCFDDANLPDPSTLVTATLTAVRIG